MNKDITSDVTCVIDAGARYGVHPSWKKFQAPLRYYMFEPDPEHTPILKRKYEKRSKEIQVIQSALGKSSGRSKINVFRHQGVSSRLKPHPDSFWFSTSRPGEGDIIDSYQTDITTVDEFSLSHDLSIDFLKFDTEGTELEILHGASKQLTSNVLGVYSEVSFGAVFEGDSSYGEIDAYLRDHGFILLSIDVLDRGSSVNKFYSGGKFGILEAADAIWIKPFKSIQENPDWDEHQKVASYLKLSAFCFINEVTDVAMQYLIEASEKFPAAMQASAKNELFGYLRTCTQILFKKLDEHMAFSSDELDQTFNNIFGDNRKKMRDFYENTEINPD